MRLEFIEEEPAKIAINFDVDETDVLRAMYREKMARRVRSGNAHDISDFEAEISDWEEDTTLRVSTADPTNMIADLQNFSDNTDRALNDILNLPGVPEYANTRISFIPYRIGLGDRAALMAQDLGIESGTVQLAEEIEAGCFDVDLGQAF